MWCMLDSVTRRRGGGGGGGGGDTVKSNAANLPAGNPITNQSISWAGSRLIMQVSGATNFNLNTKMCLVTVALVVVVIVL